jgi:hypothetical protein
VVPSNNEDAAEFGENEACCIVDADGVITMKNVKLSGSAVGEDPDNDVPVRAGFTFESGETIAVNDYVVFGKNSSTHQLDLDESIEPFLCAYAAWKLQMQDSNTDSSEKSSEFSIQAQSIMAAFSKNNEDLQLIPEL